MTARSPGQKARRAEERRLAYLECRDLLHRLTVAVGQRRPQTELDEIRAEATEWLHNHPRNR